MKKGNLLIVVFAALLSGCAVPGTYMGAAGVSAPITVNGRTIHPKIIPITDQVLSHQSFVQYTVGPYDILNVIVWDHPELSVPTQFNTGTQININNATSAPGQSSAPTGITVDAQGKIFFPYAGRVKVAGLTDDQVRKVLSVRLAKYIRNPQVSVNVAVFRSKQVNVIGEVLHSGTQSITNKPLMLLDAINAAGGINQQTADTGHIYVFRQHGDRPLVYWISAKSPGQLLMAEKFVLRTNDIIYVAPAGVSSWNRIISEVMPTIQTLWYTKSLTA